MVNKYAILTNPPFGYIQCVYDLLVHVYFSHLVSTRTAAAEFYSMFLL